MKDVEVILDRLNKIERKLEQQERLTQQEWIARFKEHGFELYKTENIEKKLNSK